MSKFIKVTTWDGEIVWINSANIVAVTESKSNADTMVVLTNAVDKGEGQRYLVPGSPEVFIESLGEDVATF